MNSAQSNWLRNLVERNHEYAIIRIRTIFKVEPPTDDGVYVYTYYDALGNPIYHGYTSNARKRALDHFRSAPWAGWVDEVRYRRCTSPKKAYALEQRLQRVMPSLCHASGITRTYHGEDWTAKDGCTDHLKGTCRLPGGICDLETHARNWKFG
jgi:hypothetical protein